MIFFLYYYIYLGATRSRSHHKRQILLLHRIRTRHHNSYEASFTRHQFAALEQRLLQVLLMEGMHRSRERFMGYCSDRQGEMVEPALADVWQRLVCFEYLPRGSPADPSHGPERRKPYQITGGICDGLYCLHIVHLVLQPTNILLDYNMMPKIVDFDLSRCYHEKQNWLITSNLTGTMGYLAPEFYVHGQMSFKSDIYSLGVIIVEILTGEKGYTLPWW